MADLHLLEGLLTQTNASNPADETPQELFDQIVALVEQEKIDDAVGLIEKTFTKGIPDIRLIVYYYYAHFSNCGVKAFADIFPGISAIINQHWNAIKPVDRKDKHVQNSLNWFFSQVLNRLKYSEKLHLSGKSHPIWEKSVTGITPHELGDLVITAQNFQEFFVQQWPKSPTKDRIMHLVKKIEDLKSLAVKNEEQETAKEVALEEEQIAEEKPNIEAIEEQGSGEPKVEESVQNLENKLDGETPVAIVVEEKAPVLPENTQVVEQPIAVTEEPALVNNEEPLLQAVTNADLPSSINPDEKALFLEELEVLSRKMRVFELFISQNDYLKAAVVARDIDQLIDNFDPLSYFPKLFGRYFSTVAKNVVALTDQYEKKESLQVKSLEKLYRTDLDMFIDW